MFVLVCVPYGAETNEDGETTNPGQPMHKVVPFNYTLLSIFTVCFSVIYAKISLSV